MLVVVVTLVKSDHEVDCRLGQCQRIIQVKNTSCNVQYLVKDVIMKFAP